MLLTVLLSLALAQNEVPSVDELAMGEKPTGWALPWNNGEPPRPRRTPDPKYPVLAKEMGLGKFECSFRVSIDAYGETKDVQVVLNKWRFHPALAATRKPTWSWLDVKLPVSSGKVYGAVIEEDVRMWLDAVGELEGPDEHCRVELTLTPVRGRFRVATNDIPECLVLTQRRAAWGDIPEAASCDIRFRVGGNMRPGGIDWRACPDDVKKHLGRTLKRWQWMKPRDRENLYEVQVRYVEDL